MIIDLTGKVDPCCYYSGYANNGTSLGNINKQSIDEIWNGEGYRELRRRNAAGDFPSDHPCHPENCLARRAGGVYPAFHAGSVNIQKKGFGYVIPIPEMFIPIKQASNHPCLVYEGDAPLPHPDAIHEDIFEHGYGRYSVWGNWLYLSSSDGTDPCENGRRYQFRCGDQHADVPLPYKADCPSGANIAKALEEYQGGAVTMEAKPTSIQMASTADCNIDCPHCFQNPYRVVNLQLRAGVVDEVLALVPYLQEFMWLGGEPYLVKRFRRFVDEFEPSDNPNLCFGFTTNGTMLTKKEIDKLLKFPRMNAAISFDSFVKESFEKIRSGANFERTLANLEHCVAIYDRASRQITVGMTILKSNIAEIAFNASVAIEKDIPLNLSPCTVYPYHERLDIFQDFEKETRGWAEAIDTAITIVKNARADGRKSILRNDFEGTLHELRNIYDKARERYAKAIRIKVRVNDPLNTLSAMRKPALVVSRAGAEDVPLSFSLLCGAGEYELSLPLDGLQGEHPAFWYITDDIYLGGWLLMDSVRDPNGRPYVSETWPSFPYLIEIELPQFTASPQPKNIDFANYGETTQLGMQVSNLSEVTSILQRKLARERYPTKPGEDFRSGVYRLTWRERRVSYRDHRAIGDQDWTGRPGNGEGPGGHAEEWSAAIEGNEKPAGDNVVLPADLISHDSRFCWRAKLPDSLPEGDGPGDPYRSPLVLLEDGRPLGPPHSAHDDIRTVGLGCYSHWQAHLYFSTSDGSNPQCNGRTYELSNDCRH
jgi:MoaA/NifB/PqqE/SkfB family radical SAM enzyme